VAETTDFFMAVYLLAVGEDLTDHAVTCFQMEWF
jgi:hypothetical protein